jgi:hypothetical protein
MPSRVVVVAAGCGSEALDMGAFADALRVELAQEGIKTVDVGAPDTPVSVDPNLAAVRVQAAPCDAKARVLKLQIEDPATFKSVTATLSTTDVDTKVRPRVAALVVAERLRTAWASVSSYSTATTSEPLESTTLPPRPVVASRASAQEGQPVPKPTPTPLPPTSKPAPPPLFFSTNEVTDVTVAAAVEWRLFSGPGSAALLGPRVLIQSPVFRSVPLRLHFDLGAAFGSVRDSLGDVSLSIATGGIGLAVIGHPGPIRLELGPKLELGWTAARGIPGSTTVTGASSNAVLATASAFASVWTLFGHNWQGMCAIDVGATLAGLDARADERPVAEVRGAMIGVRIGVGRAF